MDCLFVGCGSIADEYADGLAESRLSLAAVCDLDRDRAAAFADRVADDQRPVTSDAANGRPAVFDDTEAALAATDAPLVCVLTGHSSHATITRRALTADRHVFTQKPLALDAAEARGLVELARDRDRALGCAPISPRNPAQRRVARLLATDRVGPVRLGYAHAHVGRVTEWHDRPGSFLTVGPLYDGAVYPLSNLTAWFGPVARVRTADALDPWPPGERQPDGPTHYEATLAFAAGPVVRLTTSFYVPHRSREFTSLELHGDDGSVYLANAGALTDDPESVQVAVDGASYRPASETDGLAATDRTAQLLDGPERLAAAVAAGDRPRRSARRGAHVVSVANAIERAAADGGPVVVPEPSGRIESLSGLAAGADA